MTVSVVYDNADEYRGDWLLKRGRQVLSNHLKKSTAIQEMKQKAGSGERMIVQRRNGEIADGWPRSRDRSR